MQYKRQVSSWGFLTAKSFESPCADWLVWIQVDERKLGFVTSSEPTVYCTVTKLIVYLEDGMAMAHYNIIYSVDSGIALADYQSPPRTVLYF